MKRLNYLSAYAFACLCLAACSSAPPGAKTDASIQQQPDARPSSGLAIGQPCRKDSDCPGGTNAICYPADSCGGGFCSLRCDTSACPTGSVCVNVPYIDPTTLLPHDRRRCFLPCQLPASGGGADGGTGSADAGAGSADAGATADGGSTDGGTATGACPGELGCFAPWGVCMGGQWILDQGSPGARKPDGAACESSPPDPGAGTRLFSSNVDVGAGSEAAAAIDPRSGAFYVGYNTESYPTGGVSYSTDSGKTWSASPQDDPTNLGDPAVAVDPSTGRLYFSHLSADGPGTCAAGDATPNGIGVNVSYSDDGGKTWTHTTQVSAASESSGQNSIDKDWMIVLPDGTVLISYMWSSVLLTDTVSHAIVARSTDHGMTFTEHELDASRPAFRSLIQLAADSTGVAYASWWESADPNALYGQVRLSKSTDGGMTWSPSVAVTPPDVAMFDVPGLAVAADGSRIAVTWAQAAGTTYDESDEYASVSLDEGATFLPGVRISQDAPCATHREGFPAITPSGDVYVLWYDNRWGDGRVMWARGVVDTTAKTLTFGTTSADVGFVTDKTELFSTERFEFFTGDYLGFALSGTKALAAWGDLRNASAGNPQADIFTATATLP